MGISGQPMPVRVLYCGTVAACQSYTRLHYAILAAAAFVYVTPLHVRSGFGMRKGATVTCFFFFFGKDNVGGDRERKREKMISYTLDHTVTVTASSGTGPNREI